MPAQAAETQVGDLVVIDAWTGPAPADAEFVPVFMTIRAGAETEDVLVGAETDKAEETELRQCAGEFGVMRSVAVDEIEIPEGEATELEPCGYHVMLMSITEPLVVGEQFSLTLEFDESGEAEIPVAVLNKNVAVCTCAAEPAGEGAEAAPPAAVMPAPMPKGSY